MRDGPLRRPDELHAFFGGEGPERASRYARADRTVLRVVVDDAAAEFLDAPQQRIAHVGPDVHLDRGVLVLGNGSGAQSGTQLPLRGRLLRLFGQHGRDAGESRPLGGHRLGVARGYKCQEGQPDGQVSTATA